MASAHAAITKKCYAPWSPDYEPPKFRAVQLSTKEKSRIDFQSRSHEDVQLRLFRFSEE
ncbi:MAG: hypothetical protein M3136_04455 [Thermoproteota archaeon]|nr:hypothetical protein [Thermoproteota archaeon]